MKKIISLLLAVLLLAGTAASLAEGGAERTVDMPIAGMRFTEPAEFTGTKGQIHTDEAFQLYGSMYYAYWTYFAMTEEELDEVFHDADKAADADYYDLFYLISTGEGQTFDDFNSLINNYFDAQYATQIGQAGDTTFYLYMEPADQKFADSLDPEYKEEYLRLAALGDKITAGIECYEPYDPLVGTKVEFTTTDLDGNEISSADLFAQNEITMVNIWATWCGPCKNEMPELGELARRIEAEGRDAAIVGICNDADEEPDACKEILAERNVDYLNLLPFDGLDEKLFLTKLPTTIFVNRNGVILLAPIEGVPTDLSRYGQLIDAFTGAGTSAGQSSAPSPVAANDKGVYRVIVTDSSGAPVKGVTIQFCDDTACMMGKTDENGIASFPDAADGHPYTVHVLKVPAGYEKTAEEFTTTDVFCDVSIVLQQAA